MDITVAKSSEHNLRNLYRRWAQFMAAESWDELAGWHRSDEIVTRAAESPSPDRSVSGEVVVD